MKKIYVIVIGLIIVGLLFYLYNNKIDNVHIKIVTNQESINSVIENWIKSKQNNNGIHIYSFEEDGEYKFLLYFNKNYDRNLYTNTIINARMNKDELIIDLKDENAENDNYVSDELTAFLITKFRPKSIKVYYNGEEESVLIEN